MALWNATKMFKYEKWPFVLRTLKNWLNNVDKCCHEKWIWMCEYSLAHTSFVASFFVHEILYFRLEKQFFVSFKCLFSEKNYIFAWHFSLVSFRLFLALCWITELTVARTMYGMYLSMLCVYGCTKFIMTLSMRALSTVNALAGTN